MKIDGRAKLKSLILPFVLCLILPILFTVVLKVVDRGQISYSDSTQVQEVGLSSINLQTRSPYNGSLDKASDYLLYASFALPFVVFILAVIDLIKKRSLKIRPEFYCFAAICVLLVAVYFLFDKVIVLNYRPLLCASDACIPEPSFPSTHVMFSLTLSAISMALLDRFYSDSTKKSVKTILLLAKCFAVVLMIAMPVLRLLSGMHWLTDVFGGVLFAFTLSAFFYLSTALVSSSKKTDE